jgi:hypothetical protein
VRDGHPVWIRQESLKDLDLCLLDAFGFAKRILYAATDGRTESAIAAMFCCILR